MTSISSFMRVKARGSAEGAKLALDVGSGRLVHQLGHAERRQAGDLVRYLVSRSGQRHRAGQRNEITDVGLVARVGLHQMSLMDREMTLTLGAGLDGLAPPLPAR